MLIPAYLSLSGKKCQYNHALHKKYGDIVRTGAYLWLIVCTPSLTVLRFLGPNEISVVDTSAIPHLWNLPRGPCRRAVWYRDDFR